MRDPIQPIRILVADDHPIVRDGLVAILGTQPDFLVVGEASTGTEVITQATEHHPDVIMLDLEMPEIDGVEAIRRLRQVDPDTRDKADDTWVINTMKTYVSRHFPELDPEPAIMETCIRDKMPLRTKQIMNTYLQLICNMKYL